ncbi:hypothetical protein C8R43DRAFT_958982 [Mycena crocata]|nr:hypothetical protein C8R43DRAFT_962188 [Mycena crocata]KAJ7123833.1 hypothetical protein C8R43DRAFT_958982 [Mycena crocata]
MARRVTSCEDCSLVFPHLDPNRRLCFKCEKIEDCGGSEIKLAAVVPHLQELSCRKNPVRHLRKQERGYSNSRKTLGTGKVQRADENKENRRSTTTTEVITIDGDSSDSDIDVESSTAILDAKVKQQRQVASTIRLSEKGVDAKPGGNTIPGRTMDYLANRKRSGDPSKMPTILFKLQIFLHTASGGKTGTRVTPQSRGFLFDESMETVFRKLVKQIQEPDGPWAQHYPGKRFTLEDVTFTFKDGVGILHKYTTATTTVSKFWSVHTQSHNQYFKKAAISANTADLIMLIPVELTVDEVIDEPDADIFDQVLSKKGKRPRLDSKGVRRSKRVKLEDNNSVIKGEPRETPIPTNSVHLRLCRPIVFTKEHHTEGFCTPNISDDLNGTADVSTRYSSEMGAHLKITIDGLHFLARRLEHESTRFSPENELEAARAELNRGFKLKNMLQELANKYGGDVPELNSQDYLFILDYSSPDLFIASLREGKTAVGHLVCQPKPSVSFTQITKMNTLILDALTHYAFVQDKWILRDFRGVKNGDGTLSVFAPISHSVGADTGLHDEGPDHIESFKTTHGIILASERRYQLAVG